MSKYQCVWSPPQPHVPSAGRWHWAVANTRLASATTEPASPEQLRKAASAQPGQEISTHKDKGNMNPDIKGAEHECLPPSTGPERGVRAEGPEAWRQAGCAGPADPGKLVLQARPGPGPPGPPDKELARGAWARSAARRTFSESVAFLSWPHPMPALAFWWSGWRRRPRPGRAVLTRSCLADLLPGRDWQRLPSFPSSWRRRRQSRPRRRSGGVTHCCFLTNLSHLSSAH